MTFSDYSPLAVSLAVENAKLNGYTADGLVLDWRTPQEQQFQILLGSDILYDQKNHGPILDVIEKMMTKDGECWIGDPGRYHTAPFTPKTKARGLRIAFTDEHCRECPEPPAGQFRMIRVRKG